MKVGALVATVSLFAAAFIHSAHAADKVTFGTDWKAQAEHGGFYQAIGAGIYAKHGLEVTLRPGGPQMNHAQLLAAGKLDFNLSSNSFIALNYVKENIPMIAVAALFQKDPSVLIAHPGVGNDSFEKLVGKPIYIGADTRLGWWIFLKKKFGYQDFQIRPYTFNMGPFFANTSIVQQGYLGSEPFTAEQRGIKPVVMLIADAGYTGYGALIQTSKKLVDENPGLVQRFVNATIEGWYSYLYGDPAPGNALIKKDNLEMTDPLIAYGRQKMIDHGILDSGEALKAGIGAMNEARWRDFYGTMSEAGVYPAGMDTSRAYTLRFVNQSVGQDMKKK